MSNLEPRDHVYLLNHQKLLRMKVEPHRVVLWLDDGSQLVIHASPGAGDPSLVVSIEHPEDQPGPTVAKVVPFTTEDGKIAWPTLTRETRALYQCSCGFPCREAGKGCPQCGDPGLPKPEQPANGNWDRNPFGMGWRWVEPPKPDADQ